MSAPPYMMPDLDNDPWVEFNDVDFEDSCAHLYADCITDPSLSCRDADSGRVSAGDPDTHSQGRFAALDPALSNDTSVALEQCKQAWEVTPGQRERELLYSQVKEVKVSGKVLLSSEEERLKERTTVESKTSGGTSSDYSGGQNPPPLYTTVESIQGQTSLLLTANSPPPLMMNFKTVFSPDTYLTPELMGSITP